MATLEEQETIITQNRADSVVSVYTSNTHDIRYFKSHKEFTLIEEWFDAETGKLRQLVSPSRKSGLTFARL